MTYAAAREAYEQKYILVCNKFDARATGMATVEWVFYLSKVRTCTLLSLTRFHVRPVLTHACSHLSAFSTTPCHHSQILDFMDTVFIVARRSWSQFSFLHIYHHISIFLTYWLVTAAGAFTFTQCLWLPASSNAARSCDGSLG